MTTARRASDRSAWMWLVCLLALVGSGSFHRFVSAAPRESNRATGSRRQAGDLLQSYREQHDRLLAKYGETLEALALNCESKNLLEAAVFIRKQANSSPGDSGVIESLPKKIQAEIPAGVSPDERNWRMQLRHAQLQYAQELYLLSRRALGAGYPSYAYQLVREVAHHDSDHAMVRRLLGYVRYDDQWVTPFAARMMRDRYVWHDKYGWLLKAHVERYENGERFFQGRWISAEKETALRQDFKDAWEIRTDNYLVKTNHSLERGVEIARELEEFHDFFIQTFAGFFYSPQQLEKLFRGGGDATPTRGRQRPYLVHYYRTRDEYADRLRSKIPMIDITNGLYYTTDRIAYFYHDPEKDNNATLYHEATHQLFYEIEARDRAITDQSNFWIVEGIACYMESFKKDGQRCSLGDPRYERFAAARYRYLVDGYYVPLGRFAAMGLREFQSDTENISKNYSQASGLSHFFMHYDGGRYRDALIAHLAEIYQPQRGRRDSVSSLAELLNVDFDELDRQYGEYLKEMETGLAANSR
ncbi:MAG: DUF1570 domain-containing protein [Planctomycetaceae bacterium]